MNIYQLARALGIDLDLPVLHGTAEQVQKAESIRESVIHEFLSMADSGMDHSGLQGIVDRLASPRLAEVWIRHGSTIDDAITNCWKRAPEPTFPNDALGG